MTNEKDENRKKIPKEFGEAIDSELVERLKKKLIDKPYEEAMKVLDEIE